MKLLSVVGARPNFIKIAPFIREVESRRAQMPDLRHILVHTGQHYDAAMSGQFFSELGIPEPDYNLEVGSGSHAEQVGHTMIALEKVLIAEQPDWVIVVGDVNASMAAAITAKKLGLKVCHIEAGIRSGDLAMPEEINRLVTDRLSDLCLTPDALSIQNLLLEGKQEDQIDFVGNIMIDTLMAEKEIASEIPFHQILDNYTIASENALNFDEDNPYLLFTLHRPENVDSKTKLTQLSNWISQKASEGWQIVWPIHPRTQKQLHSFGLEEDLNKLSNLFRLSALPYQSMLRLTMTARLVITDSGGLQEESCVLGIPFLVLRESTERPITLAIHGGSGFLCGSEPDSIQKHFDQALRFIPEQSIPEKWDGRSASRCLDAILKHSI